MPRTFFLAIMVLPLLLSSQLFASTDRIVITENTKACFKPVGGELTSTVVQVIVLSGADSGKF